MYIFDILTILCKFCILFLIRYIYIFIWICAFIYINMCLRYSPFYANSGFWHYVYMYIYTWICLWCLLSNTYPVSYYWKDIHVCIFLYVYICVCTYIYTCRCVCIHMYSKLLLFLDYYFHTDIFKTIIFIFIFIFISFLLLFLSWICIHVIFQ